MLYLVAIILPPVAVLACGKPFRAIFVTFPLTLLFYVPGLIHALSVVAVSTLFAQIQAKRRELRKKIEVWFLVEPCFRCHEFTMKLLDLSPNGRSVHYECRHCKKKSHAAACTPKASRIITVWHEWQDLLDKYNRVAAQNEQIVGNVFFDAPAAPLPYEQTTRTPIPEAVRSEVWRRDGGRCVKCGSKHNLQFDHIIPVAKGGATTVANLQLLCQSCNGRKGKRI